MRVVLDTHALYHVVQSPGELTAAGREVVEDPANELLISAITVWEFGLHAQHFGQVIAIVHIKADGVVTAVA